MEFTKVVLGTCSIGISYIYLQILLITQVTTLL